MRLNRTVAAVGLSAALALSVAACGSSGSTASSGSSSSASADVNTPTLTVAKLTGQQTAVTLDTATVGALTKLGVKIGLYGTAKMVNLADGGAVAFPITGGNAQVWPKGHQPGYVTGEIDHEGSGLTLTVGSKKVTLSNFVINPGTSMLTGTVNGTAGVPLFFLDGSNLAISKASDGTYHLDGTKVELLASAATALDTAFGVPAGTVPSGTNAVIGTAHIVAA